MENIGCIVYNDERFCSSKEMSVPQLTFFSIVVQHELCHMWFGNLVTMRWWNDLWLNEAFATVLSYMSCAAGGEHVEEYKDEAWLHFNSGKLRGVTEDMLPSTHPVAGDCPNTDAAESLFDALTYQKGSSLMKQLIFIMGWETFCTGLRLYFKTHAWKNTILDDFISCMQTGYDQSKGQAQPLNLSLWAQNWLKTKGVNKIEANVEQEGGKITRFTIKQTHCRYADALYHRQTINIGLLDASGKLVEKIERVQIEDKEITEIATMVGKEAPAGILLNSDDWGFGHFVLDGASIKVLEGGLANLESKLWDYSNFFVMEGECCCDISRPQILTLNE